MTTSKIARPAFQSIELDPIDARLEARAAERGIPTLVTPKTEQPAEIQPPATVSASEVSAPRNPGRGPSKEATPRRGPDGDKFLHALVHWKSPK